MNRRSTRHSMSSTSSHTTTTTTKSITSKRGSSRNRQPLGVTQPEPAKNDKEKASSGTPTKNPSLDAKFSASPKVKIMLTPMMAVDSVEKPVEEPKPISNVMSSKKDLSAIFEQSEMERTSMPRSSVPRTSVQRSSMSTIRQSRSLSQFSDRSNFSKVSQFARAAQPEYDYDELKYARRQQDRFVVWAEYFWFGFAIILNGLVQLYSYLISLPMVKKENMSKCDFANLVKNADWSKFLNDFKSIEVAVTYVCVVVLTALLSLVPIGRFVTITTDTFNDHRYVFNGIGAAFVIVGTLFGFDHYSKWALFKSIDTHFTTLFFINLIVHIFVASFATRPSFQANSGSLINPHGNFLSGWDSNPTVFKRFSVKIIFRRISIILALIFNVIYLSKALKLNLAALKSMNLIDLANFDRPSVIVGLLLFVYLIDLLIFENHTTFSYELHQEFLGANALLRYALYPFTNVMILRHFQNSPAVISRSSTVLFTVASICFLAGVFIKRSAQRQKHAFRMNADADQFRCSHTITTHQIGRREFLLASKWWSVVRHPNYFGDLLCSMSLAATLLHTGATPSTWTALICTLWTVLVLVLRQRHVNRVNVSRYNTAWQRYCQIVPNSLVPFVF